MNFSNAISSVSIAAFNQTVLELLKDVAEGHNINLHAPEHVEVAIQQLINLLSEKSRNSMVVILIDEYDKPYTSAYLNKEVAEDIPSATSLFR